jgi:hypothetical protein
MPPNSKGGLIFSPEHVYGTGTLAPSKNAGLAIRIIISSLSWKKEMNGKNHESALPGDIRKSGSRMAHFRQKP